MNQLTGPEASLIGTPALAMLRYNELRKYIFQKYFDEIQS